jgi:hypothetical protein
MLRRERHRPKIARHDDPALGRERQSAGLTRPARRPARIASQLPRNGDEREHFLEGLQRAGRE